MCDIQSRNYDRAVRAVDEQRGETHRVVHFFIPEVSVCIDRRGREAKGVTSDWEEKSVINSHLKYPHRQDEVEAIRDPDFVQGGVDRGVCDLNKFRAIVYPENGDCVNASLHKKR